MSLSLSPQMRVVALVGLVAVLGLGGAMFVLGHKHPASSAPPALSAQALIRRAHASHRIVSAKHSASKVGARAAAQAKKATPARHAAKPAAKPVAKPKPKAAAPAKPRLTLYQNLPSSVLSALQQHEIVVAALENPAAPDDTLAVEEAQAGAADAGVGFVELNVLSQADIGQITKTYGVIDDPAVLVFRRPGVVVARLNGYNDRLTVAQAIETSAPGAVTPASHTAAAAAPAAPAPSKSAAAASSLARADLRAAVPAVEAYAAQNNGYTGMTVAKLRAYGKGVKDVAIVGAPTARSYCLRSKVGKATWYKHGPGGDITTTPCTGP